MSALTEDEIVEHVQKCAKFLPALKGEPYFVDYDGATYYAADTRDLVVKICKAHNIPVCERKMISLVPTGRCKMCDNLTTKPEACFLPNKVGTQYIDAPYCSARKLHYNYIRAIDEGRRDCRHFICEGMT